MIRRVALTIPCVVGPYTNINCTLTLKGRKIRISPRLATPVGYCSSEDPSTGYLMQENDERFVILPAGDQVMATSRGISDNGYLNFDPRNERKLFFEHTKVVARLFDKGSMTNAIIEVHYTAREGGPILGNAAKAHVKNYLPGNGERLLDISELHPDDWFKFQEDAERRLAVHIGRKHFASISAAPQQLFID